MKYPLDSTTFTETLTLLAQNNQMQILLVERMADLLIQAMDDAGDSEDLNGSWYKDSETLLKELQELKMWHESRRFNESVAAQQKPETAQPIIKLDEPEVSEGEMSEDELAKHFKERKAKKKPLAEKSLKEMTLEEINEWEAKQDNSNDIYKIAARVKNLARGPGSNLTPQGEMLCNTFVHLFKTLYDFSETVQDKPTKIALINKIRDQEGVPGGLIAAFTAGVRRDAKDKKI